MSLALVPVIPNNGIAQKGVNKLVHISPAAYEIMVLPSGTPRDAETLVNISPVAAHCHPPEGINIFIKPDRRKLIKGQVNGVAYAAIELAITVAKFGLPSTTVYLIKPIIAA